MLWVNRNKNRIFFVGPTGKQTREDYRWCLNKGLLGGGGRGGERQSEGFRLLQSISALNSWKSERKKKTFFCTSPCFSHHNFDPHLKNHFLVELFPKENPFHIFCCSKNIFKMNRFLKNKLVFVHTTTVKALGLQMLGLEGLGFHRLGLQGLGLHRLRLQGL